MCCQTEHYPMNRTCSGKTVINCGCGCISEGDSQRKLENYREYLKKELASVERKIINIPDTDK